MEFKGLEKNSVIEWPGKIVAVAYTGRCNFRCPFCQNKDLVLNPEKIPTISEEEIIDYLESNEKWLDGISITGGEPTLHASLPDFARKIKERGFEFGLETNGTNPQMVKELIEKELVDYIALDVKAPLVWEKYKEAIGVDNKEFLEKIKETMNILQNSEVEYEARTTVVPRLLDEEDLEKIGGQIKEKVDKFYLQQFIPENTLDKEYENIEPYTDQKLKEIRDQLKKHFEICKVRNIQF